MSKSKKYRCKHRNPRDYKRCKMTVSKGVDFCHHHNYDLRAMKKDFGACLKIQEKHFPKNHHPACDRKSENDCDCPDFSKGAHAVMTVKAAIRQSKSLAPLYRNYLRVTMADKVSKITRYYDSITEDDLYLPPESKFRQFRFFTWNERKQQIVVRVVKDNFANKKVLLKQLRRHNPIAVYYTTARWLNPQGIGPDPTGKFGRAKFVKKKWCTESGLVTLPRYHNTLLKKDLYFDVDYDNKDYNEGIRMVQRTIDCLKSIDQIGIYTFPLLTDDDFEIVFSGGKGFHVIVNGFYDDVMVDDRPFTEFVNDRDKNERVEEFYRMVVETMKESDPELLLDFMVTYDNRRIIRLPGTVHHKTLRVCTRLSGMNDERIIKNSEGLFDEYIADSPIR